MLRGSMGRGEELSVSPGLGASRGAALAHGREAMSMTERERPAVLIADDEPVNLRTLAELLRKDYEVYVAPDGFRALEIAQGSDRPALISYNFV